MRGVLHNRRPRQFPAVLPYELLLTWRRFYPHQPHIRKRFSNALYSGFLHRFGLTLATVPDFVCFRPYGHLPVQKQYIKNYTTFSSFFPFGHVAENRKRFEKSCNFSTNTPFIQLMSFFHITLTGFSIVLIGCTAMSIDPGVMTFCFI